MSQIFLLSNELKFLQFPAVTKSVINILEKEILGAI